MDDLGLTSLDLGVAGVTTVLGAVVGSFLNVVIARVPRGESIVRPRSRCPRCLAPIAWYDNVPVASWILLRARCRRCHASISFRYPLVEALVAAAGWAAWRRHDLGGLFAAELAFVAILVALAFIDVDTWLLPHVLTWPLIALGIAASAAGLTPAKGLLASAAGAGGGFAAFAAVAVVGSRVFKREALGWGDVWLLAGIGAFLGARALLPVVLLASLQGSVVGIALVLFGRGQPGPPPPPPISPEGGRGPSQAPHVTEAAATTGASPASADGEADWIPPRHAVPFGPFLALGALEWLYLGAALPRLLPALRVFR